METARDLSVSRHDEPSPTQSLLAILPFAMMMVDEHGMIESVNRQAALLFGWADTDAVGQSLDMLIPQLHRHFHDQTMADYLGSADGQRSAQSQILIAKHRDGHDIPVEVLVGDTCVNGQRLFACFVRPFAARYDIETPPAPENATPACVECRTTTSLLVHELNQPMTAMTNFLAAAQIALTTDAAPETLAGFLEGASDQSLRARHLLQRLQDFVGD